MTRAGRLYELATLGPAIGATGCSLLPTPTASAHNDSEAPESFLARREQLRARHGNNGAGIPLAVAMKLLPTPDGAADNRRTVSISPTGKRLDGSKAQVSLRSALNLIGQEE